MERYRIYINRSKASWGQDDLLVLFWLMEMYCQLYNRKPKEMLETDWKFLAAMIPFRNGEQCMFKFLSMQIYRLEDFPWDAQSEHFLFEMA